MRDQFSLHHNHQMFWTLMAQATGGDVEEIPGALLVTTGISMAPYNQVHLRLNADEPAVLAHAARRFEARGLPWRIVAAGPSPAAADFAGRRGQASEPLYPIMALDRATATRPAEPPASISAADSLADLRDFVECAAASFGHEPELIDALINPRTLSNPAFRLYLAWQGDECAGVSVGVHTDDTVGVYFVGVVPRYRGRGIGTALTDHAVRDAAIARTAVLQATPAGLNVYRRMGFQHVGAYHLWDFPASGDEAAE